jgi:hypothetical protein
VVLTDRPAPHGGNLKVFSHALGEFEITLFAAPELARRYRKGFPDNLDNAPLLLPTQGNALRGQIERWLETHDLAPLIVGEFEDSALLTTFGRAGIGLFPAPSVLGDEIAAQLGAEPVGVLTEVREQYYAISNERRIRHPAVEAIRKAPVSWHSPPADSALLVAGRADCGSRRRCHHCRYRCRAHTLLDLFMGMPAKQDQQGKEADHVADRNKPAVAQPLAD